MALSENACKTMEALQCATEPMTYKTLAEAAGVPVKSMNGILNGLAKKGLVIRSEIEGFDNKVIQLTDTGLNYSVEVDA